MSLPGDTLSILFLAVSPTLRTEATQSGRKRQLLWLEQLWCASCSYSKILSGFMGKELACLACTKTWVRSPAGHKHSLVVHTCNPGTQEVEAGGSEVRTYPRLHRELEASLDCLSEKKLGVVVGRKKNDLCLLIAIEGIFDFSFKIVKRKVDFS